MMKQVKLFLLISIIAVGLYANFVQAKPIGLKQSVRHQIITVTYMQALPSHLSEGTSEGKNTFVKTTSALSNVPSKNNTVTVVNKHNEFFEMAIIFNEKLQQFLAFFTRSDDEEQTSTSTKSLLVETSKDKCKGKT